MIYKMLTSAPGAADANGATTRMYAAGETLVADAPWKEAVIQAFVSAGLAEQAQTTGPTETKAEKAGEAATVPTARPTQKRRSTTSRKKTEG